MHVQLSEHFCIRVYRDRLSGGATTVACERAVEVKEPRLLLLDEPTHGLSGSNRAKFLSLLQLPVKSIMTRLESLKPAEWACRSCTGFAGLGVNR